MYKKIHSQLLSWYEKNGRHDLPWRGTTDAYKIWVSEIMLQQTQVKTVLERFYFPFLEKFPTLKDLAEADEADVLKAWEGLGYYTRARNLHKSAKLCSTHLPLTIVELNALSGIGKSTAHAIAAFAYKTPVPILDANVKRILYRFFGKKIASEKELWELSHKLFDEEYPFEFNQAMMDLGSLVCRAKETTCKLCPLESTCKTSKLNPLEYPQKKEKKIVPIRKKDIVVFTCRNRFALKQRESQFLNGLWGFIEFEENTCNYELKLGSIIQKYSHFHLHANVYSSNENIVNYKYFAIEEIKKLPLSKADIKILKMLS